MVILFPASPVGSKDVNSRGLSPANAYLGGRASLLNFARRVVPSGTLSGFVEMKSNDVGGSLAGISGRGVLTPVRVPAPPFPPVGAALPAASERMRLRKSESVLLN